MFRNRATLQACLVAMSLAVATCGGTGTVTVSGTAPPASAAASQDFPVSVVSGGVTTTVDARPESIVSLSPTATEMVFAVGAGPQVVAVDEYSYYPEDAPVTDLSGFTPNLEAILAFEPDLVLVNSDVDGMVGALEAVGVPVVVLPTASVVDDAYEQVRLVGRATGHAEEGERVALEMKTEIDELVASIDRPDIPLTYYHELGSDGGGSFYSVTSSTFIGEVFGAFGLENIADPADADGLGYPVLSVEFIIEADPDLIFHTTCCGDTTESISARPGWDAISAVREGAVTAVDDDLSSRWGPRLVEFFRIVAGALEEQTS